MHWLSLKRSLSLCFLFALFPSLKRIKFQGFALYDENVSRSLLSIPFIECLISSVFPNLYFLHIYMQHKLHCIWFIFWVNLFYVFPNLYFLHLYMQHNPHHKPHSIQFIFWVFDVWYLDFGPLISTMMLFDFSIFMYQLFEFLTMCIS